MAATTIQSIKYGELTLPPLLYQAYKIAEYQQNRYKRLWGTPELREKTIQILGWVQDAPNVRNRVTLLISMLSVKNFDKFFAKMKKWAESAKEGASRVFKKVASVVAPKKTQAQIDIERERAMCRAMGVPFRE